MRHCLLKIFFLRTGELLFEALNGMKNRKKQNFLLRRDILSERKKVTQNEQKLFQLNELINTICKQYYLTIFFLKQQSLSFFAA